MEAIAQILKRITDSDKELAEAVRLENLKRHWPAVAGAELTRCAEPVGYKNKVLLVETSSSAWAQQMLYYKQMIINKFQQVLPGVTINDIKTKATGVIKESAVVPEQVQFQPLSPEEQQQIQFVLEELGDLSLKAKLQSILQKAVFWRQKDKRQACPLCGKRFVGTGKICAGCAADNLREEDVKILRFLEEAPWSRYTDISREKNINESNYHRVKEKLIQKTQDKIRLVYFEHYKSRSPKLLSLLRKLGSRLALLKTGLAPEKLTEKILENQIGSRLYKLISAGRG